MADIRPARTPSPSPTSELEVGGLRFSMLSARDFVGGEILASGVRSDVYVCTKKPPKKRILRPAQKFECTDIVGKFGTDPQSCEAYNREFVLQQLAYEAVENVLQSVLVSGTDGTPLVTTGLAIEPLVPKPLGFSNNTTGMTPPPDEAVGDRYLCWMAMERVYNAPLPDHLIQRIRSESGKDVPLHLAPSVATSGPRYPTVERRANGQRILQKREAAGYFITYYDMQMEYGLAGEGVMPAPAEILFAMGLAEGALMWRAGLTRFDCEFVIGRDRIDPERWAVWMLDFAMCEEIHIGDEVDTQIRHRRMARSLVDVRDFYAPTADNLQQMFCHSVGYMLAARAARADFESRGLRFANHAFDEMLVHTKTRIELILLLDHLQSIGHWQLDQRITDIAMMLLQNAYAMNVRGGEGAAEATEMMKYGKFVEQLLVESTAPVVERYFELIEFRRADYGQVFATYLQQVLQSIDPQEAQTIDMRQALHNMVLNNDFFDHTPSSESESGSTTLSEWSQSSRGSSVSTVGAQTQAVRIDPTPYRVRPPKNRLHTLDGDEYINTHGQLVRRQHLLKDGHIVIYEQVLLERPEHRHHHHTTTTTTTANKMDDVEDLAQLRDKMIDCGCISDDEPTTEEEEEKVTQTEADVAEIFGPKKTELEKLRVQLKDAEIKLADLEKKLAAAESDKAKLESTIKLQKTIIRELEKKIYDIEYPTTEEEEVVPVSDTVAKFRALAVTSSCVPEKRKKRTAKKDEEPAAVTSPIAEEKPVNDEDTYMPPSVPVYDAEIDAMNAQLADGFVPAVVMVAPDYDIDADPLFNDEVDETGALSIEARRGRMIMRRPGRMRRPLMRRTLTYPMIPRRRWRRRYFRPTFLDWLLWGGMRHMGPRGYWMLYPYPHNPNQYMWVPSTERWEPGRPVPKEAVIVKKEDVEEPEEGGEN